MLVCVACTSIMYAFSYDLRSSVRYIMISLTHSSFIKSVK